MRVRAVIAAVPGRIGAWWADGVKSSFALQACWRDEDLVSDGVRVQRCEWVYSDGQERLDRAFEQACAWLL